MRAFLPAHPLLTNQNMFVCTAPFNALHSAAAPIAC